MPKSKKPTSLPALPFPPTPDALHQEGHWLWIPLRKQWCDVSTKPEEIVRQKFIRTLVEHYGYSLDQMDQERRTQHGHRSPRADIVIWQSANDMAAKRSPALVVECKTDSIDIQERDYYQAASYTVASGCEIFVATNQRHTSVFKLVARTPGEFVAINEIPKASDWGDAKRLKEVLEGLRAFNRKEFQDLLFECHSILRDVHKMDPGRAFDTISKILFVKMYIERSGLHGTFTVDYLDKRAQVRLPTDAAVHDGLFEQTRPTIRPTTCSAPATSSTFRKRPSAASSGSWSASTCPRPATTSRGWRSRSSSVPPSGASWASSSRRAQWWSSWLMCSTHRKGSWSATRHRVRAAS